MKYTEEQVIDIIKSITKKSPKTVLKNWKEKDSNTLLDLSEYKYESFIYTFPVIIDGKEIALITIADFAYTGHSNKEKNLMLKYLGNDDNELTEESYPNDNTYLNCYLTFKTDKLELPLKVKDFYAYDSTFLDINNQEIKYRISYGWPDEDNMTIEHEYRNDTEEYDTYLLFNNVVIQIEKKEIEGYSLGERINENIKQRIQKNENN